MCRHLWNRCTRLVGLTDVYTIDRDNIRDRDLVSEGSLELVRRALRRGLTREESIKKWTQLHWIEVKASLRILEGEGSIQRKGRVRFQGVDESCLSYRHRRQADMVAARKTRGRPRRELLFQSLKFAFVRIAQNQPVSFTDHARFKKEKRRRRH